MIKLHVGRGEQRGPLTVFPIWQERSDGSPVVLGCADTLVAREVASPQVGHLEVTALGQTQVLLLDGDVLVGGWQDRVAVGSVLLTPGVTTTVDVRCVEQDRWSGGREHAVAPVRATAFVRGRPDQHEVWRRVAVERRSSASRPDISGLEPLPGQSGVLFGIGGRPALLELFADETLLAAAWPRILAAASREAAGRPDRVTYGYLAREFVGLVEQFHVSSSSRSLSGQSFHAHAWTVGIAWPCPCPSSSACFGDQP